MTRKGQMGTTTITKENGKPIPPLEIKLAWLFFFATEEFVQTGEWPLPPGEFGIVQSGNRPANSTALNIIQAAEQVSTLTSSSPSELICQAEAQSQPFPTEWQLALAQKRLPGSPEPVEVGSPKAKATGYRYRASAYWEFASRLLAGYQERTSEHVERDFDGCKLTLAVIVAWLRFPLFGGGAGREWMTLGLERLRQEAGMKNERLMDCLTQLQEIRLLQPFRAIIPFGGKNYPGEGHGLISRTPTDKEDEGKIFVSLEEFCELKAACADLASEYGGGKDGYWQSRAIQKTNNFYRFKPAALLPAEKAELDVLPIFNPFDSEQLAAAAVSGKNKKVAVVTTTQEAKPQPGSTLPGIEEAQVPAPSVHSEANSASNPVSSNESEHEGSPWEVQGKYVRHIPQEEGSSSKEVGTYFPASQSVRDALSIKENAGEQASEVLPTPSCFKEQEHVHVVVDVVEEKEIARAKPSFQATPEGNNSQGSKGNIAATSPDTLGDTLLAEAYLQLNELNRSRNGYSKASSTNNQLTRITVQEQDSTTDSDGSPNDYEPKSAVEKVETSKQPTLGSRWYERRLARLSEEKLTLHNIFLHLVEVLGCEDIGMPNMPPLSALELAEQYELARTIQVIEGTKDELARGKVRDNPIGLVIAGLERGFVPGASSREEVQVALAASQRKKRASYLAVPPNHSSASAEIARGSTYPQPHGVHSYRERTSYGKNPANGNSKNRAGKGLPFYPAVSTNDKARQTQTEATAIGLYMGEASPSVTSAGTGNTPDSLPDQSVTNDHQEVFLPLANWDWQETVNNLAHRASYNGFGSVQTVQELLSNSHLEVLPGQASSSRTEAETASDQAVTQVQVVVEASWQLASLHQPARQAIALELRRLAPGCLVSFASRE